jgi:hypothetical protein
MKLKRGFGRKDKIVIEHVDLDQLDLIVDGEKLTNFYGREFEYVGYK